MMDVLKVLAVSSMTGIPEVAGVLLYGGTFRHPAYRASLYQITLNWDIAFPYIPALLAHWICL